MFLRHHLCHDLALSLSLSPSLSPFLSFYLFIKSSPFVACEHTYIRRPRNTSILNYRMAQKESVFSLSLSPSLSLPPPPPLSLSPSLPPYLPLLSLLQLTPPPPDLLCE